MQPCQKRLDADCFRHNPAWAKQAFAYRLVHLLTPKQLTRRLPKLLRLALIAPGVIIPPGLVLPDGTLVGPGTDLPSTWSPGDPVPPGIVIVPGTTFPPDWTPADPPPDGVTIEPGASFPPGWNPGDPVPPGIIIVPGTTFPPGWTSGDPPPEGVTIEPGASFPPGWNPPDPVPEGLYPAPALPPAAVATGPAPPTYVAPGTPGPVHRPSPSPAAACEHIYSEENFTGVTPQRISDDLTHVPFVADLETWSVYLIGGLSGTNHLQIVAGYIAMYQSATGRYQYVYLPDSDALALRCATKIRVQNKRRSGGGVAEVRLYDAQPPGGNILFSEAMRTSGSYGFTDLLITSDITGYTDLHLCLYVYNNRWQEITRIRITET